MAESGGRSGSNTTILRVGEQRDRPERNLGSERRRRERHYRRERPIHGSGNLAESQLGNYRHRDVDAFHNAGIGHGQPPNADTSPEQSGRRGHGHGRGRQQHRELHLERELAKDCFKTQGRGYSPRPLLFF